MKKLLSGLALALALSAGLVAVSGANQAALADQCGAGYPPCGTTGVDTNTPATIEPGEPIKGVINLDVFGSAPPVGEVTITFSYVGSLARTAAKSAAPQDKKIKIKVTKKDHGKVHFKGPKFQKKGKYKAVVKFNPKNPRLKNSKDVFRFTVK
ncbi:hypothetical protein ABLE68_10930 [Nocardioides sp. CN2-186]|uniref:hypothetical protein n=1 Tax=Nocardioides tweenelious TaxID=3156607 RepID=UPI0032B50DB3